MAPYKVYGFNHLIYMIRRKNAVAPIPKLTSSEISITDHAIDESYRGSIFSTDSTSIEANGDTPTSWSTEDTLSMISSPWSTTESWYSGSNSNRSSEKSSYISWTNSEDSTSSSAGPKTSTSYGITTPFFNTISKKTVTLLSGVLTPSDSQQIQPLSKRSTRPDCSETLSSWTLETYTSTGMISDGNADVKVKYPWSPCSVFSGTDFYPSTESLLFRKSNYSVAETGRDIGGTIPINYTVFDINPVVNWISVKEKGFIDVPNVIDSGG